MKLMEKALKWIENGELPKLSFDGDILDPESLVEDLDIESGDSLDVLFK